MSFVITVGRHIHKGDRRGNCGGGIAAVIHGVKGYGDHIATALRVTCIVVRDRDRLITVIRHTRRSQPGRDRCTVVRALVTGQG